MVVFARSILVLCLLLAACAPATAPAGPRSQPATGDSPAQPVMTVKSLVVATTAEANGFGPMFSGGTSGPGHLEAMLHRSLAQIDDQGEQRPAIAAALPTQGDGSWRVFADGRMETTWKFNPGVRWHDGTPLSVAMDRDSIVSDLYFGLLEAAHSYVSYRTNGFDRIDARTTKYPYDPTRALSLMGELGWTRAPDGLLRNERGESFAFPFATTAGNEERIALQTVIANMWKANGFDVEIGRVPLAVQSDPGYAFPTTDLSGVSAAFESNIPRIDGRNLKSPQNPRGQNVWGYDNAEVNGLLDQWLRTTARPGQIDIEAAVVYRLSEDLPILPINYRIEVITVSKGVTVVPIRSESPGNNSAWNVETWDRT